MIKDVAEQLNRIIKADFSSRKIKKYASVPAPVFIGGDYKNSLVNVLKKVSPNGKVLTVSSSDAFLSLREQTEKAIESVGAKPVNFIVDDASEKIEDISQIFACGDDVRAVIFFERKLAGTANYFATIRNVPSVYIPISINVDGGICPEVFIKTGDKIDAVKTLGEKYVLLDDRLLSINDTAEAYAFLTSKFISVFDSRIKSAFSREKTDVNAFFLLKDAVIKSYKINSVPKNLRAEYLLEQGLKAETANYFSFGELVDKSAIGVLKILYGDKFNRIKAFSFLIGVYGTAAQFNSPQDFLSPDYNKSAETVSKFFGVNETDVLDGLKTQFETITSKSDRIVKALDSIKQAAIAVEKTVPIIQKTFVALGGEKFTDTDERFVVALLSCGDYPFINGMSVARESGFLSLD